jgi:CRP-like cAMP-binding protein
MPFRNSILHSLSPEVLESFLTKFTPVGLPANTVLYQCGIKPKYSYFLTSGIAVVVTSVQEGQSIEVELIGNEGAVGILHLLGQSQILTSCFMPTAGTALRIEFSILERAFRESQAIREPILEFIQMKMITVSQLAACNRLHSSQGRLARWLLMAADRSGSTDIALTQESLAEMLGASRTTVTETANVLERKSLISSRRGEVTILDRTGLESAACSCYEDIKRLYGDFTVSLPDRSSYLTTVSNRSDGVTRKDPMNLKN